jgi:hypothetical protein
LRDDDPTTCKNRFRSGIIRVRIDIVNTSLCDQTFFNSSPRWVRSVAPSGTQIPTFSPGLNICGKPITGWRNGSKAGVSAIVNVNLCWTYTSNWMSKDSMEIVNYQGYYVYGLNAPGGFTYQFCTMSTMRLEVLLFRHWGCVFNSCGSVVKFLYPRNIVRVLFPV